MTPPPPPPPPAPGVLPPIAPTSPNSSTPGAAIAPPSKVISNGGGGSPIADHNDQLMAAIRNGINLKPAKTNDRSTPAFIKQSNGVLDDNEETASSAGYDKSTSIDEMKDALQAELRNTLKRKIKKQELEEGDCQKNDEIERSIEHTRNEVQLKLNGPSLPPDTPKVNNPLKTIVDMVDKERGVVAAPTKQPSPLMAQKKSVSVPSTPTVLSVVNGGSSTLRKVSAGQYPTQNGTTTVVQKNSTPVVASAPITKATIAPVKASPVLGTNPAKGNNGAVGMKSPTPSTAPAGKLISNGSSTTDSPKGPSPVSSSVPSFVNASQTAVPSVKLTPSPVKVANGSLPSGNVAPKANGTAFKINSFQSKLPPTSPTINANKTAVGNSYSNTLPRANPVSGSKALPKTSTGAIPPSYTSSVKVSIGSFGDSLRSNATTSPSLRNGNHAKFEPLTIDTTTSNGGSTNGTSSPTTPKELLSPQVRSGAASIRPSQIRTLTKAGSVVSHTDILETSKPVAKLPVTLVEPVPVLTAAAAVSPPPKVSTSNVSPLPTPPAKERTPLFEKATKDAPKSPLNRWNDSGSVSGGTARKLLLTHGRPNFTIKRSNSRQGFDVDVPDAKGESVKPVFRILTDLEKMEQQDDSSYRTGQAGQVVTNAPPQSYVSFARDLSNAPNNHPDVIVVTKPGASTNAPADPFLSNLKDIKIDIGEMKIVNAKNS
ncbi:probable serine/threonine-protein kinase nek3 [Anopheles maculipalpis]|uniref:probable serine/threonine-protein kinase nek3 n=1 Tax=Anopheles maculipalpis TaxID=1496333 RepID=UPI002158E3EC|nr:probable serine/threonine-protein kinase nek3 [Anopheles maculipalpis]